MSLPMITFPGIAVKLITYLSYYIGNFWMAGIFWYSIVYPTDYRKCHLAVFQQMISEGENAIMKEKKKEKN